MQSSLGTDHTDHSFSAVEEAFFREGDRIEAEAIENFTDLDEGYRPVTLWQRLFAKSR
jgi:hypothetical protein